MGTKNALVIFLFLFYLCNESISESVYYPDVGLDPVMMIINHYYEVEEHQVTTEDGYILTLYRIPRGLFDREVNAKRPAVLIVHGLSQSSSVYLDMGPGNSLAYVLADSGYDVWLGNSRGTYWSRNHTTLDLRVEADVEKFYDYSWHEMGHYDLPAVIDYILDVKKDDSLYYVGHSQGATQFLVMGSTRPEYNEKIKLASLMAPAAFFEHKSDGILKTLSKYIYRLEALLKKHKIYEFPFLDQARKLLPVFCSNPENAVTCVGVFALIGGKGDEELIDPELAPTIFTNTPSNSSMKQWLHFGQLIKNGGFSYFDYGRDKNRELYGTEKPPAYDLSKITSPIAIYYSKNDNLATYADVQNLISKLPNIAKEYLVPIDSFNHVDFVYAKDIEKILYEELMSVMKQH